MAAAGIDKVENVLETFDAKIEARVVNMTTGEFVDTDPTIFDFEKSKYDAALSVSLKEKGVKDIAGIQRVTKESPVYISKKEDADLYLMAQEFQKSVSKGSAKPEYEKSNKPVSGDIV